MTTNAVLAALRASHDRFAAVLGEMDQDQVAGRAYPSEWSVGQVASHLGSGAEIFGLWIDAGATGSAPPGPDQFQPVWARWDAKTPAEQARDGVAADGALLDRIAALSPAEAAAWRMDLFGSEQDLSGLLMMRLSEHAVHTWDIAVVADPAAGLADDATALLVDALDRTVARAGKPSMQRRILVETTAPERRFLLALTTDGASLTPADGPTEAQASLHLPAEALIRLVYGRLDGDHTPAGVRADAIDLDELRADFPGF